MNINGKNIQENILLINHTTFRIGGPAKYFFEALNVPEIKEAVLWAKEKSLPYFILGGGSNLLVSDKGFDGLVIKVQSSNFKAQSQDEKLKVETEAGVPLIKIILETVKLGYSGAEWGFGIPGTIGGAIFGNAGRLGQDISQVVESVLVLDSDMNQKILDKKDCGFSYRESVFKKNGAIILSANLVFQKKEQNQIDSVLSQAKKVVREHPPFASAGCIFKNYQVIGADDKLLADHPELKKRIRGGYAERGKETAKLGGKIGVGYLIEQCGLKGRQNGEAKIWEGHANYIVNSGGAKASEVFELISVCKEKVGEKFNIVLEEEIRYLGF